MHLADRDDVCSRAVLRSPLVFSLLAFTLLTTSCKHGTTDAPRDGGAPDAASKTPVAPVVSATTSAEPGGDEIRPVYPADAGPPDPLAQRLCDALHREPEQRQAACCTTPAAGAAGIFDSQCTRVLTAAVHSHAVSLAEEEVSRCVDAMTRATSRCDWVVPGAGAGVAPLPVECEGAIHGTLRAKARCRSSLECAEGLQCQGLSSIDVGTCAPPKPSGQICDAANDMLAVFTRQSHLGIAHPECAGYCRVRQCKDALIAGAACKADMECGHGRCETGKCVETRAPAVGEPCVTACADGARCVKGVCAPPKAEGSTCDSDPECRGACVRPDGGAAGMCAKSCPAPFQLLPHKKK
jgi:hypothetical protein